MVLNRLVRGPWFASRVADGLLLTTIADKPKSGVALKTAILAAVFVMRSLGTPLWTLILVEWSGLVNGAKKRSALQNSQSVDSGRRSAWGSRLVRLSDAVQIVSKRRNRKARGVSPERIGRDNSNSQEPQRGDRVPCGVVICIAPSGLGPERFRNLGWSWG
jgi:hypothetical protein